MTSIRRRCDEFSMSFPSLRKQLRTIAALAPRPFFSNSPLNDSNFDVEGVRKGISAASAVHDYLGAGNNLVVVYPDAAHDFPPQVRLQAYRFIDKVLNPARDTQAIK